MVGGSPISSGIGGLLAQMETRGIKDPLPYEKRINHRKKRKLYEGKEFYFEVFWHHGRNCRGIELHHKESGRNDLVLHDGSRRELFKAARLVMAKLKDPELQKRIDRLSGKETDLFAEFTRQQQEALRQLAQQQAIFGTGMMKVQHPSHHATIQQVAAQQQAAAIQQLAGIHQKLQPGGLLGTPMCKVAEEMEQAAAPKKKSWFPWGRK